MIHSPLFRITLMMVALTMPAFATPMGGRSTSPVNVYRANDVNLIVRQINALPSAPKGRVLAGNSAPKSLTASPQIAAGTHAGGQQRLTPAEQKKLESQSAISTNWAKFQAESIPASQARLSLQQVAQLPSPPKNPSNFKPGGGGGNDNSGGHFGLPSVPTHQVVRQGLPSVPTHQISTLNQRMLSARRR